MSTRSERRNQTTLMSGAEIASVGVGLVGVVTGSLPAIAFAGTLGAAAVTARLATSNSEALPRASSSASEHRSSDKPHG